MLFFSAALPVKGQGGAPDIDEQETPPWRLLADTAIQVLQEQGVDAAVPAFERALGEARRAEAEFGVAFVQVWMGQVRGRGGDFEAARAALDEALEIYRSHRRRTGAVHASLPSALGNRAIVARRTGDFDTAQRLLEEQLELLSEAPKIRRASAWNNLGSVHYDRGDMQAARAAYRRSIELRRGGDDAAALARSLGNLANLEFMGGDLDGARDLYLEALELYRSRDDGPIGPQLVVLLRNIADLHMAAGDFDEARSFLDEAVEKAASYGEQHASAALLVAIAELALYEERWEEARESAEWAAGLAAEQGDQRTRMLAELTVALALLERGDPEVALGVARMARERATELGLRPHVWFAKTLEARALSAQPDRSRTMYEEAISDLESWRDVELPAGAQRRHFLDQRRLAYHGLMELEFEVGNPWAAFGAAERARTRTLRDLLLRDRNGDGEPTDLASSMSSIRSEQELERLLDGRSLLAYTVTQERLWIASYDESGLRWTQREIGRRELRSRVAEFGGRLADRALNWRSEARSLGDLLLPERFDPGERGLVIVPDDTLWQVAWAALEGPRGSWLDGPPKIVGPSLEVLRLQQSTAAPSSSNGAWLWSARQPWTTADGGSANAPARRFTSEELRSLTEADWRRIGAAPVLHFAGHGFLETGAPLRSAIDLDLAPPGTSSNTVRTPPRLFAEDLLARRLDSQLVVFSACSTGTESVSAGEGLAGFSWAALSRGARTVVASLWRVDDDATSQLERSFYLELLGGELDVPPGRAIPAAMQHAMIETRSTPGREHPFYWAAWQVVGDGAFHW